MISGFGGGSSGPTYVYSHTHNRGNLPVPFNIPNVLYNLLFEDIGLEFTRKQQDMIDAVSFSYRAIGKMEQRYAVSEQELKSKMIQNPEDESLQEKHSELQLDRFQANQHFKELVIVLSDLLEREQYEKIMAFSGIAV